ncbi:MAG: metallophosphoesterase [Clostridia bacterium]|nr:metallophosphoesterase [Clostridia bacterium]
MTYVMSDLHGYYEKYKKMLDTISFSDEDELYILGDVVDRGPQSAELLLDMSMRSNVYPILGNHDMIASILLKKLCVKIEEDTHTALADDSVLRMLAAWQLDGGQATIESFKKLSPDDREALIDYFEEFVPYEVIEVSGRKFLLVHGGIPLGKRHIPLEKQETADLISERPDYGLRYYEGITLVTGHTPTAVIDPEYRGRIFHKNGHLAIDCGAGFGLPLGCIRLEDFREFYVE